MIKTYYNEMYSVVSYQVWLDEKINSKQELEGRELAGVSEMRKPGFSRKPAKTWVLRNLAQLGTNCQN